jgi:hypothetical protein
MLVADVVALGTDAVAVGLMLLGLAAAAGAASGCGSALGPVGG